MAQPQLGINARLPGSTSSPLDSQTAMAPKPTDAGEPDPIAAALQAMPSAPAPAQQPPSPASPSPQPMPEEDPIAAALGLSSQGEQFSEPAPADDENKKQEGFFNNVLGMNTRRNADGELEVQEPYGKKGRWKKPSPVYEALRSSMEHAGDALGLVGGVGAAFMSRNPKTVAVISGAAGAAGSGINDLVRGLEGLPPSKRKMALNGLSAFVTNAVGSLVGSGASNYLTQKAGQFAAGAASKELAAPLMQAGAQNAAANAEQRLALSQEAGVPLMKQQINLNNPQVESDFVRIASGQSGPEQHQAMVALQENQKKNFSDVFSKTRESFAPVFKDVKSSVRGLMEKVSEDIKIGTSEAGKNARAVIGDQPIQVGTELTDLFKNKLNNLPPRAFDQSGKVSMSLVPSDMRSFAREYNNLLEIQQGGLKIGQIDDIIDAAQKRANFQGGMNRSATERMYGSLSHDLNQARYKIYADTLEARGGFQARELAGEFRAANKIFSEKWDLLKNITSALENDPSNAAKALIKTDNVKEVKDLVSIVTEHGGEEAKKDLAGHFLDSVLKRSSSDMPGGVIGAEKIEKALSKYDPEILNELMGKDGVKKLNDLIKIGKIIEKTDISRPGPVKEGLIAKAAEIAKGEGFLKRQLHRIFSPKAYQMIEQKVIPLNVGPSKFDAVKPSAESLDRISKFLASKTGKMAVHTASQGASRMVPFGEMMGANSSEEPPVDEQAQ